MILSQHLFLSQALSQALSQVLSQALSQDSSQALSQDLSQALSQDLSQDSVLLRHVFIEGGVATACSCRDLFSLELTSRQLIDVATFWSWQLLSRQPGVVATFSLSKCCRDNLMLSRLLLLAKDVATTRCCRDLIFCRIVVATTFSF